MARSSRSSFLQVPGIRWASLWLFKKQGALRSSRRLVSTTGMACLFCELGQHMQTTGATIFLKVLTQGLAPADILAPARYYCSHALVPVCSRKCVCSSGRAPQPSLPQILGVPAPSDVRAAAKFYQSQPDFEERTEWVIPQGAAVTHFVGSIAPEKISMYNWRVQTGPSKSETIYLDITHQEKATACM